MSVTPARRCYRVQSTAPWSLIHGALEFREKTSARQGVSPAPHPTLPLSVGWGAGEAGPSGPDGTGGDAWRQSAGGAGGGVGQGLFLHGGQLARERIGRRRRDIHR